MTSSDARIRQGDGFYGRAWSILLGHEMLHAVGDGSMSCSIGIPGVGENADT